MRPQRLSSSFKRKREEENTMKKSTIKKLVVEDDKNKLIELPPPSKTIKFDTSPRRDETSVSNENIQPRTSSDDQRDDSDDEEEDYELLRKRNVEANNKFLSQIGMFETKQQLSLATKKPKREASQRGLKKKKVPEVPQVRRKSLRIARIDPEGQYLPEPEKIVDMSSNRPLMPPECPLEMTAALLNDDDQDYHKKLSGIITSTKITQQKPLSTSLQSYQNQISKLRLDETGVAKVVQSRAFSLAIHPTTDKLLLAAGGKWGGVGLWDMESSGTQDGVVAYKPHISPVNWVHFSQHYPAHIYSCSYDGSCRYADFETGKFSQIYAVPEDEAILLRNADFLTPDTLLVSQSDGCVAVVDRRTESSKAESVYECHVKALRTVSIHPNGNHFCTASLDACLRVWDIRRLKTKGQNNYISEGRHGRIVNSAYFSPITGNHILSTSDDNTLHVYDVDQNQKLDLRKIIRHNNHTGRWLTKFRAVWHPAREDVFVVGSMVRPRQIEVFNTDGLMIKNLLNEDYLGSVCSINVIHLVLDIIAGANSSGRVHVFR